MKKLLYTFAVTLLLLLAFLGLWLTQSYQKDAATMRRMVEGEVNSLVSEDYVYPTLQAFMHQEEAAVREGAVLWQNDGDASVSSVMRIKKISVNQYGRPDIAEITIIRDSKPVAVSHFNYGKKYIALENLPETIADSMYRKFGIRLVLESDHERSRRFDDQYTTMPRDPMTVRVKYINSNERGYPKALFTIRNYHAALLLGLIPEFIFGLILFGATGLAFATAYRNLKEQKEQLHAKDILVANVAHELKTPIATVGVALEALNLFDGNADPERRRDYLAIGQTELKRLDAMADRAIDSLQDTDLEKRLDKSHTDLLASINEAWRGLSLRYNLPAATLQLTWSGDTTANVDEHYWYHLVYNLLDNACKYGGDPLALRVDLRRENGQCILEVSDNGPGIPPDQQDRVFDRFYRIERPGEGHRVKGHGLGLSFVRQIARAHGGEVSLRTAGGGGACFTVRIPA